MKNLFFIIMNVQKLNEYGSGCIITSLVYLHELITCANECDLTEIKAEIEECWSWCTLCINVLYAVLAFQFISIERFK